MKFLLPIFFDNLLISEWYVASPGAASRYFIPDRTIDLVTIMAAI
jgi:hypothetical protein